MSFTEFIVIATTAGVGAVIGLTSWVLREVIALRVEVTRSHARFEEKIDNLEECVGDHEHRIRALEAV